ncbi:MAG: cupin domain-containing protein [Candidatus Aminicenantaceae bacterium]
MFKISKEEQPEYKVFDGIVRMTLGCGKDVLMARFDYKKGSKVPPHKHSYEQVTTILKGKQKVCVKDEEIIVKTGDSYIAPANFIHEQISLEDTVTIDAWSLAP